MEFWQIQSPDYDDYRDAYINGTLAHPFSLPSMRCGTCGIPIAGHRVLPFQLPESLHRRKELRSRWPISSVEHHALCNAVEVELRKVGVQPPELRPGDLFQPAYLDVPSKPRADFLWSSIPRPVVSQRVRDSFLSLPVGGLEFSQVVLRKIGKREARLAPPIPESGEPEDIIDVAPLMDEPRHLGPYYELIVLEESDCPPGAQPISICAACGRKRLPSVSKIQYVMRDSMWKGQDVFYLGSTYMIIVTARVKRLLESMKATNIDFRKRNET